MAKRSNRPRRRATRVGNNRAVNDHAENLRADTGRNVAGREGPAARSPQDASHEIQETEPAFSKPITLKRRLLRWGINAWLVFHLLAIVVAPGAAGDSSEVERSAWSFFAPYLKLLYLNHGYHFFAPEPVFSTLVDYEISTSDGESIAGRFPDRSTKPRLLFHRYFMLTEFLPSLEQASPELRNRWHESYARHLCRLYNARQVKLYRVTHRLPTMQMVRDGIQLDDPRSYTRQLLGTFEQDRWTPNVPDNAPPPPPQGGVPSPPESTAPLPQESDAPLPREAAAVPPVEVLAPPRELPHVESAPQVVPVPAPQPANDR